MKFNTIFKKIKVGYVKLGGANEEDTLYFNDNIDAIWSRLCRYR